MPLHEDRPDRVAARPDGTVVRNLTDEEYAATYDRPGRELHTIPADALEAAEREAPEHVPADYTPPEPEQ